MRRLLIIGCSERKVSARERLPAIDLYDGPAFRVLRKYLREIPKDAPTVLILSAKFGLIASERTIPSYDCRLTPAIARKIRRQVLHMANKTLQSGRCRAVGVCVGKSYQSALASFSERIPAGVQLDVLDGGLGKRLTALRNWLRRPARG